jgi:hypothetical protein
LLGADGKCPSVLEIVDEAMTNTTRFALFGAVSLLLTTGAVLSPPAAATDLHQAVKLCDANPNCALLPPVDGTGMQMVVKTSQGEKIVDCPAKGPCTVSLTKPTGGTTGVGKGVSRNVNVVLARPPVPPGKTGGGLLRNNSILDGSGGFSTQGPAGTGGPATTGPALAPVLLR